MKMNNSNEEPPIRFVIDTPKIMYKYWDEVRKFLNDIIGGKNPDFLGKWNVKNDIDTSVTRKGHVISMQGMFLYYIGLECYNQGELSVWSQIDAATKRGELNTVGDVQSFIKTLYDEHNKSIEANHRAEYFETLSKSRGKGAVQSYKLSELEKNKLKSILSNSTRFQTGRKRGQLKWRDVSRKAKKAFRYGINGRKLDDKFVKDLCKKNHLV